MATHDELVIEVIAATARAEAAVMNLIVSELEAEHPVYDDASDQAAGQLRQAAEAVEAAEACLAAVDAELSRAEAKAAEQAARLDAPRLEARVEARRWCDAYDREIARMQSRRQQLAGEMTLLTAQRNRAQAALASAEERRKGHLVSMALPMFGGQHTDAYKAWRMPQLAGVVLKGDRSHCEWGRAVELVEHLTAIIDGAPEDHGQFWDGVYRAANPPQPPPGGRAVADELLVAAENAARNEGR